MHACKRVSQSTTSQVSSILSVGILLVSFIRFLSTTTEKMASHDQSYKAGETKGRTEEKTGQTLEAMKQKAQEGKDKTAGTAQSAKERTRETKDQTGSYLSEKAGATKDKTSETAQGAKEKAMGAAQATKEKASEMTESARETAQAGKEKTGGVLHQTGEQIKSMAQGAADAVKHTFGMADTDEDPHATGGKREY